MSYCKHVQKKYVVSYKTSVRQYMEYNVNVRTILYCIIFMFFLIYIT